MLGVIELIVVHWEQVDQWEDGLSFRCAAPSDLSPQRDTSEPSHFHRHTRETRDIRQVCFGFLSHFVPVDPVFNISHSDNHATGVAYSFNPLFHPDGPTETRTVRGTKLVVLSAGSFGTPGILERSGIGAKSILEGVGVKQRIDLPSIGENYQGLSLLRARTLPSSSY